MSTWRRPSLPPRAAKGAPSRARIAAVPRPDSTPLRHSTTDRPRATADRPRATPDRPRATPDRPRATTDRPRATTDRPRATTPAGAYGTALGQLSELEQRAADREERRLRDSDALARWVAQQQDASAARAQQQAQGTAAQQQAIHAMAGEDMDRRQNALEVHRSEIPYTVTRDAGVTRQQLIAGDIEAQGQLANIRARTGQHSLADARLYPFLQAANAATASAASTRIRGEEGEERARIGEKRSDLLVRREDAENQLAAARAQAAADIREAEIAAADRAVDRAQTAAERAADREQRANLAALASDDRRRARELSARNSARAQRGRSGAGVSASEQRQRSNDAERLRSQVSHATTIAAGLSGARNEKTGKPLSRAEVRDNIRRALGPDASREAINAAMSTVYDPRNRGLPMADRRPLGAAASELDAELRRRESGGTAPRPRPRPRKPAPGGGVLGAVAKTARKGR